MFFRSKPLALPTAAEALPGRATPLPVPALHHVNGQPLAGPYPGGRRDDLFRAWLLLGRRAAVLEPARGVRHRRRLSGRADAQPDL